MINIRQAGGFSLLLILFLASCQANNKTSYPTTIILSKEYSSKNCQKYFERIDSTLEFRFVNAYNLSSDSLEIELGLAHGIILTGGADINPARYGADADTIKCGSIDNKRDSIEFRLLSHVKENSTPCLGFCRGLQIMNVFNGGSLHPHLPDTLSRIHRGLDGATTHSVKVIKHINSLNLEVGSTNDIISHHHQGINKLGADLDVWAVAPDGLSEGIRHSDTTTYPFYIGVQWHPERCSAGNEFDDSIGKNFINAIISK